MQAPAAQKVLLILDYTTNWYQHFKGVKVGDYAIKVRLLLDALDRNAARLSRPSGRTST